LAHASPQPRPKVAEALKRNSVNYDLPHTLFAEDRSGIPAEFWLERPVTFTPPSEVVLPQQ
jgi:hypothetical protein